MWKNKADTVIGRQFQFAYHRRKVVPIGPQTMQPYDTGIVSFRWGNTNCPQNRSLFRHPFLWAIEVSVGEHGCGEQ